MHIETYILHTQISKIERYVSGYNRKHFSGDRAFASLRWYTLIQFQASGDSHFWEHVTAPTAQNTGLSGTSMGSRTETEQKNFLSIILTYELENDSISQGEIGASLLYHTIRQITKQVAWTDSRSSFLNVQERGFGPGSP